MDALNVDFVHGMVATCMDLNACMNDHGIKWNPAKQKLRKEIMALTFAKGRDLCGLFS